MNIAQKINKLKKEKKAIILAHNYQLPEVQDIADVVGDSLGLSIEASRTNAEVIVFCGVHFMAETAKILSPEKTVLLPAQDAGCPMADMITPEKLKKFQDRHPGAVTVCYVNSSAAVKALCDYCCTSANATKMVQYILRKTKDILFIPDQYLAKNVSRQVGHDFTFWRGYCPVHAEISARDIAEARERHPGALVLAHPECKPSVTRKADVVASTEGMARYIKSSPAKEFIVATETGILHRMKKENPGKTLYPAKDTAVCQDMKKITLEKVLWSLENSSYEITVPEAVMKKARRSIERMLKIV
ncbi:MAG TPA: quinolinate synthase NadA [Smithella sp.]|mgnify:CR=1 FL=1|nr:quinolinate synthase NadA [Smithella sp.]